MKGGLLSVIFIWIGWVIPSSVEAAAWKMDSIATAIYSAVEKSQVIEITDSYDIINSHDVKITVFHPEGLNHAQITIPYDELTDIVSFSGTIQNPLTGKTIQKLRLKDLHDRSWIADFSVFEDNRLKYLTIHSGTFPLSLYRSSSSSKSSGLPILNMLLNKSLNRIPVSNSFLLSWLNSAKPCKANSI